MPDPKSHVMERVIGFGNPSLFGFWSEKIDFHVDASFHVALQPFCQMLTIMAHDPHGGTRAPWARMLMTEK